MGGDDRERDPDGLPGIPIFFSTEDLPPWLRPTAEAPQQPKRETRARTAWAITPSPTALHESPFGTAADATWQLLAPPTRPTKRARRASGTR